MMTARRQIWALLIEQPMTIRQLEEAIGVTHQTISRILGQIEMKYIAHWVVGKGPHRPAYRIGTGVDAPKPKPQTNAEKSKRYRQSEHGAEVCRKLRTKWRKTRAGKDYDRIRRSSETARKRFESQGVAAIDPLLAILYR